MKGTLYITDTLVPSIVQVLPQDVLKSPPTLMIVLKRMTINHSKQMKVVQLQALLNDANPSTSNWTHHGTTIMAMACSILGNDGLTTDEVTAVALILSIGRKNPQDAMTISQLCNLNNFDSIMHHADKCKTIRKAISKMPLPSGTILNATFKRDQQQQPPCIAVPLNIQCNHPHCTSKGHAPYHKKSDCHQYRHDKSTTSTTTMTSPATALVAHTLSISAAPPNPAQFIASYESRMMASVEEICAHIQTPSHETIEFDCMIKHNINTTNDIKLNMVAHGNAKLALAMLHCKIGIIDLGASLHFEGNISFFKSYETLTDPIAITDFNSVKIYTIGKGDITYCLGKGHHIRLNGVYHIPGACASLISVSTLINSMDCSVKFRPTSIAFLKNGSKRLIAEGCRTSNGLYMLEDIPTSDSGAPSVAFWASSCSIPNKLTWHRCLGHP